MEYTKQEMDLTGLPVVNITTLKDWGVSKRTNQSNLKIKQKSKTKQKTTTKEPQTLFDCICKAKDKKNYAQILHPSLQMCFSQGYGFTNMEILHVYARIEQKVNMLWIMKAKFSTVREWRYKLGNGKG